MVVFTCFMFSCSENRANNLNEFYNLNGVKNQVPLSLLETYSEISFENSTGDIKKFSIDFKNREVEKPSGDDKYTTEEIDINLTNDKDDYALNIYLSSNKINDKINEFLQAALYTNLNNGLIPAISIGDDGQALICELIDNTVLNGKEFRNVFRNYSSADAIGNDSFEFIYYTIEMGIIGFKDEFGDLWVLKEYR